VPQPPVALHPDLPPLAEPEPGSFRDPSGHVFYRDGRVLRRIEPSAAEGVRALVDAGWFRSLMDRGTVVQTSVLDEAEAGEVYAASADGGLVLEHERIPFVAYPYEWPFE